MKKVSLKKDWNSDRTEFDWTWTDPQGARWYLQRIEGNHWSVVDPDGDWADQVASLKEAREVLPGLYSDRQAQAEADRFAGWHKAAASFNSAGYTFTL